MTMSITLEGQLAGLCDNTAKMSGKIYIYGWHLIFSVCAHGNHESGEVIHTCRGFIMVQTLFHILVYLFPQWFLK